MKLKNLLALVTCGAFAFAATAAAQAGTATGTITVKWNTQATGSITLVSDYNSAGVDGHVSNQTPTVYTAANGGTGTCTATGGGVPGALATTDFGSVTPDSVQTTDCLYKNGVNADVVTTDSLGYSVATSATVPAAQGILCLFNNGTYANNLAVTTSTRTAAVAAITTTCTGGENLSASGNLISTTAPTTGTNLGGDIELALAASAPSGAQSVTVTYTLTLN